MITNHVTDKKRSKKLAKYLPQEGGLFYWIKQDENDPKAIENGRYKKPSVVDRQTLDKLNVSIGKKYMEVHRAFLSTELNEWLPTGYVVVGDDLGYYCCEDLDIYIEPKHVCWSVAREEQNAKADTVLYLIKEGIIKLGE